MKFQLLTALLLSVSIASAAPVAISGIARDGSHKNALLPGAPVQLIQTPDGKAKTVVDTTTTDAGGRFRFAPRELGKSDLLFANIPHGGYDYTTVAYDGAGNLKQLGLNVNPQKVELLVFDTTTQPNAAPLDFQVHHLAIKSTPTGLHVIERIVVENPSNLTYLGFGPRHVSVMLNVPKGARNVKIDPKVNAQMVQTNDGWGIVKPIVPSAYGEPRQFNAVIFSYDMDWPSKLPWGKTVDLSREATNPTKFFFVARQTDDKELQVSAPQLGAEAPMNLPVDGKTETRLVNAVGAPNGDAAGVPAGEMLDVKVSRPVSGLFWGFAGLVGALCLFLPVALLKPKRAERRTGASVSSHTSARGAENAGFAPLNGFAVAPTLTPDSRELVQHLADLDDAFEAGQVDEAAYQSQRAAWKKQLIDSLAASPDDH